jgi:heat shock protein 4
MTKRRIQSEPSAPTQRYVPFSYLTMHILTSPQDWLYDDGEDATKAVYLSKIDELRAVAGPIIQRYLDKLEEERQARQKKDEEEAARKRAVAEEAAAKRKAEEEAKKKEEGKDTEMKDAPVEETVE